MVKPRELEIQNIFNVSPMQQGMLYHSSLNPSSSAYFQQSSCKIAGKLRPDVLELCLDDLIGRHDALRTNFLYGTISEPKQIVFKRRKASVIARDISGLPRPEQDRFLRQYKIEDREQGFDLTKGPLFRLSVIRLAEEEYELVWSFHHIIMDGWCLQTIMKEVFERYEKRRRNEPIAVGEPVPSYSEYIKWLERQNGGEARDYWIQYLEDYDTKVTLPGRTNAIHEGEYDVRNYTVCLSGEATKGLERIAREQLVTVNAILQTAWGVVLSKYNRTTDVVFGSVAADRPAEIKGVEEMIGLFINTVPVRIRFERGEGFSDLLQRVHRESVERQSYQYFPLAEIQSLSPLKQELIDHLYAFQNFSGGAMNTNGLGELRIEGFEEFEQTSYDFNVTVVPGETYEIRLDYNANAYENWFIAQLGDHYRNVLEAVVKTPDITYDRIDLLSPKETEWIVNGFNNTAMEIPIGVTAEKLFEDQVDRTPDEIAVVFEDSTITYMDLDRKANRLAHVLREKGSRSGDIVGIMAQRSVEMIVAVLAVWKAGGAYVPIDPDYPPERIRYILNNSGAKLLLAHLPDLTPIDFSGEIIGLNSVALDEGNSSRLEHIGGSGRLAYVIYTSGSTGNPKGVLVEHASYAGLAFAWREKYQLDEFPVRVLQLASFSFDVFAGDVARALFFGGRLHICPEHARADVPALYELLRKHEITIFESTPKLILPLMKYIYDGSLDISSLKLLILGSDLFHLADYKLLLQRFGRDMRILNSYGVTEATIDSSCYEASLEEDLPDTGYTPIGKPLNNVKMYVVNADMQLQAVGVIGELCIGGIGVARGYLNRPELSAEKFVENPFSPGEKIYRTGDMARWLPDGNIDFLGRMDYQVKIRGYRIEVGEIESQLLLHPSIEQAVVAVKEVSAGESFLCAYLVCSETMRPEEAREYLSQSMPEYMVPARFIFLDRLPLSQNGKVDRKALPEPEAAAASYEAPEHPVEAKLAEIWAEVLGVKRAGRADHFFELGGHSLKAMTLVSRIGKELQASLPLRDVFRFPTLRAMADRIRASKRAEAYASIPSAPSVEGYPLTSAQRRLFIINQMEGPSTAYNMPFVLRLEGEIDGDRLERTFQALVNRHEAFRTVFAMADEQPVQRVLPEAAFRLERLALREESELAAVAERFVAPFDLGQAPLLRAGLAAAGERKAYLLVDMHHMVSDGTSMGVLVDEFMQAYRGEALAEQRIQYKDYAVWQNGEAWKAAFRDQEQYWLKQFEGEIPVLSLPTDYVRPQVQRFDGGCVTKRLDAALSEKLHRRAGEAGATLYMTLLAAYCVLLSKYSGQEDIVVGTAVAGRPHADLERMIGMFVGTLALRNYPQGEKTFRQFLEEVRTNALEAFENESYPYEELVEKLNLERDMSRNPLFDTMFVVQNMATRELELEGLSVRQEPVGAGAAKFDLTITAEEEAEGITLAIEYATALFSRETVERMAAHYVRILEAAAEEPEAQLSEIDMMTAEERRTIVERFNDTAREYPRERTIHQLFEEQAARRGDQPALAGQLTYREVNEKANALAMKLRERGIGADRIVAVMDERSVEMMIAMLAVLKAGGAYLPMDPDYPADRIGYMLQDSGAELLLTKAEHAEAVRGTTGLSILELKPAARMELLAHNPPNTNAATDLAYMMYTSGSTGKPKGVMVEHRNVVRLVLGADTIAFKPGDRILQTGAPVFDACTFEIWGALLNGLELYMADKYTLLDPEQLEAALKNSGITIMWLTSPLFDQLSSRRPAMFNGMKFLLVGGDTLTPRRIQQVRQACPGLQIINGYGPTENTTFSTCYTIDQDRESSIPIGRPISNSTAYIVDRYGKLQPIGVPGELWVGGDGVARGYRNLNELTAEKFIPDPFAERGRVYRTGDMARWLPDGNIEFMGRTDFQLKIRGFRVELGEIERMIMDSELAEDAIVAALESGDGTKSLCAYVVPAAPTVAVTDLHKQLKERLPDYMVPAHFVLLNRLPLNANGKVDRKALPEPEAAATSYEAPEHPVEAKLAEIWAEVLGVKRAGRADHFFELGGHSLKAMTLVSRIGKELQASLPLRDVFRFPTLRAMADRIRASKRAEAYASIPSAPSAEGYPLTSAQRRLFIIEQMEGPGTAYNMPFVLRLEGEIDGDRLERTFQALVNRHEAFRTVFAMAGEQPVQRVLPEAAFRLERLALSEESELAAVAERFVAPFDLGQAPLLRAGLAAAGERKAYLLVDMHHIVSDGTSMGVLVDEFMQAYRGEALAEQRIQYKDYAVWQSGEAWKAAFRDQEQYWLKQFEGEIPVLNLPTDYARPQVQRFDGGCVTKRLDASLSEKLHRRAGEAGATLYMTLLAAYYVLLGKYSGQEDIVVGTAVAGRPHADLERMIGMFVGTLALRNYPQGEKTFRRFLEEVRTNALEAFENESYPYEELVEKLNLERDMSRNPLFDTMFVVQNMATRELELEGLSVRQEPVGAGAAKFDLTITAEEEAEGITLAIEYATALFSRETVERMAAHYVRILEAAAEEPEAQLSEIDMMTAEERRTIVERFNDTAREYPRERTIHQLFEEQAARRGDQPALAGLLTYREVNEKANALAMKLRERGIGADRIVAVMDERSIEMVIAMLAVLKAGGAYLPMDPDYPADRIGYMLQDSGAKLLLTKAEHAEAVRGITGLSIEILELEPAARMERLAHNPPNTNVATDLAYMMYTSGSTGKPKGVMVEHRNVVRLVCSADTIALKPGDRILQTGVPVFDPSAFEIWGALVSGLELYIADKYTLLDPERLEQVIRSNGITAMQMTTPLFHQMANDRPQTFSSLKRLMMGGDVLSPKRVAEVKAVSPELTIVNAYGPTENTVISTIFSIRADEETPAAIPIGRPIHNSTAYIVDRYGKLQPIGVPGELWVGGDGVARGYRNLNELTAEKFIPDPFTEGGRLYRTGDMARWLPDGNIEFMGRTDFQLKIRGFRIELGEIEQAILELEDVKETVVVAKHGPGREIGVCAYVVAEAGLTESALQERLAAALPKFMIPTGFMFLDKLPLNGNGKIDKRSLPEWTRSVERKDKFAEANNLAQMDIVDVWRKVLRLERIGIHDSFFEIGGHSLLAIQVISELRTLGYMVQIHDLFKNQTPASLGEAIRKKTAPTMKRISDEGEAEAFIRERLAVKCRLIPFLSDGNNLIVLAVEGLTSSLQAKLEFLLDQYLDTHIQPHYIVGWSGELADGSEDAFRLLVPLEQEVSDKRIGHIMSSIAEMQSAFEKQILEGRIAFEYEASPSQQYHLVQQDFSGTVMAWENYLRRDLIDRTFFHLTASEDLMRSTLRHGEDGFIWSVHEAEDCMTVPYLDLSSYDRAAQARIMQSIMKRFFLKPYNLEGELLYRALIVKKNLKEYAFILPFSHAIFDYMSSEILKERIVKIYESMKEGGSPARKDEGRYRSFVEQITKGPMSIDDLEIMRTFELVAFEAKSKQIQAFIEHQDVSRYTVVRFDEYVKQEAHPAEVIWERSLGALSSYFKQIFHINQIPLWLTNYGRRFGGSTYFDTIGEFIDYVPLVFATELSVRQNSVQMKERLAALPDRNLHFANLMFHTGMKEQFPLTSGMLSRSFRQIPINLNYLGEMEEDGYGLEQADIGHVNADDRSRILCTVWHTQGNIHMTVVLPFHSDVEIERERLRKSFESIVYEAEIAG